MRAAVVVFLAACTGPALPTPPMPQQARCIDCVAPPTRRCERDGWQLTVLDTPGMSTDNAIAIVGDDVHLLTQVKPAPGADLELLHLWAPIGGSTWQRETIVTSPQPIVDAVAADAGGELAIAYGIIEGEEEIEHVAWRSREGAWTNIRGPVRRPELGHRSLVADRAGRMHLTYAAPGGALHHLTVSRDGASDDDPIGDAASSSALALDADDRPVVAYLRSGIVAVAERGEADWTLEDLSGSDQPWVDPTLAIDDEGTMRLGFGGTGAWFGYYRRKPGGSWRLGPQLADSAAAWTFALSFASGRGVTRVAYADQESKVRVATLDRDRVGSEVAGVSIEYHLAVDGLGGTHLVLQGFNDSSLQYAYACR